MIVSAAANRSRRFVSGWIAEIALLPAESRPRVADRTPDRMRSRRRAPVNGTALEVIVFAGMVRRVGLVRERITEASEFPVQAGPFVADAALHHVRASRRLPEDRAALE